MTSITRRAAIGTIGAGLVGAALWPRRELRAPAGRAVVEYWEKWVGAEGEALQRLVDDFNRSQNRIWVRVVPVSDIAAKAAVAIGGGDPPDVVGLYSYNIPQFAESRAVVPLDGMDAAAYAPAVRKLLTYHVRQWAGVNTIYNLALYYNKALFREAGILRPPRNVKELDEAAARLDVCAAGGKLERVGFLPNMPGWWPYAWPVSFGGRLYDAATDTAEFADAPTVAAYEWIAGYPARLGLDASREFGNSFGRSYHTAQDPFMTGRAAMIVQGPWIANFIRLHAPTLDYGAVPVPVAVGLEDGPPRGLVEADVLMIPRGCRQPEAALEFVRYMQRREVQERLALDHGKSSPMEEVSAGFFDGHPNRDVRVHDAITRSPLVQVLPQTRVWQQYADMTIGAFDRVWQGENVPRVLSEVERRAQQLMDLAAVRRRQRAGEVS